MATTSDRRWAFAGRSLGGVLLLTALWLVLVQADTRTPAIGIASVLAAGAAGMWIGTGRGWRLRPAALFGFIPFFLTFSLLGALDVVVRAFAPRRPLAPALLDFRPRLDTTTPAGVFFLEIVSLLPGTLCAEVSSARVVVHVIDHARPNAQTLRRLEERVAALFGVVLSKEEKPTP